MVYVSVIYFRNFNLYFYIKMFMCMILNFKIRESRESCGLNINVYIR